MGDSWRYPETTFITINNKPFTLFQQGVDSLVLESDSRIPTVEVTDPMICCQPERVFLHGN